MPQANTKDEPLKYKSVYDDPGVFAGTNVQFKTFWDYLETEKGMEAFHKDFPKVRRNQTRALIKDTSRQLDENIRVHLENVGIQLQEVCTHLRAVMESNDSLMQQQKEEIETMSSLLQQQKEEIESLKPLAEQQDELFRSMTETVTASSNLAERIGAILTLTTASPANRSRVPSPTQGSGPSRVPSPPPTASAPENADPNVIELYPDNATRDLTLRLSERDYAELCKHSVEGGFSSLQVYFNYLLLVGEKVIANRLVGKRPFSGAEDETGPLSFDDWVVAAIREEPRFTWLQAVLDDWLLPRQKKKEPT